ncbi:ExeM/NucH family extracellular endonuclease [Pengzhenrongella frigida]|uniref:ExeM/NucH family extracellular endonuclease n=1 Tax=Pengzhenrongella frigida TaxID=1259133 RepID=A0A4Q5N222_9MICO|nr:ExeM/NucH family extracellular endonuclease [Cellulomonas sp. HLT2-17]RYV52252.1 ExeM/NucH family extracellular endonuclease [Cellulomonas sp. HLT2-17]
MHAVTSRLARRSGAVTAAALTAVAVSFAGVGPAWGAVSPTSQVIINEVYGAGGNAGAVLTNDYIELYNTGTTAVDVSGWSVQYASAAGTNWSGLIPLTGSIAAQSYYLVQGSSGGTAGTALPTAQATGAVNLSGTTGNVALASSATKLACLTTACAADPVVVDLVGFGAGQAFAGTAPAPAPSATTSIFRTAFANTANNVADFVAGTPTPQAGSSTPPVDPPVDPPAATPATIPAIQGTGAASTLLGQSVVTDGVVTAVYPTGGLFGFAIQTPGSGGDTDVTGRTASDGLFVYQVSGGAPTVTVGQHVQVTGTVAEFNGLTQITVPNATGYTVLADTVAPVAPVAAAWPTTDAARETLESMLFAPTGDYTVTNTYSTGQYGEVGLAFGTTPLLQSTEVGAPGSAEAIATTASNAARGVVLDDGASTNFLNSANTSQTPPYVSLTDPVRVGALAEFNKPVIVDYRNNTWKLNPTTQVTSTTLGADRTTFKNTRTAAPDVAALATADLTVASFNVLNYFTTLGSTFGGCTAYNDRAGVGITTNTCNAANGPRGAWDAASLQRQQDKIVAAINATDADVTGLMEIENSATVDGAAATDEALATLVDALNAGAGSTRWAFVPSSTDLPDPAGLDVITNAIIYQPASVVRVGDSRALGDQSDTGEAFVNAREPIGQAFAPAAGGEPFFVAVNHLKSKGSAGPLPGDADAGDGQGASNASRVAQTTAIAAWVPTVLASYADPITDVALLGDFNAYTQEDPLQVLYAAGYTDAASALAPGEYSYSFSGLAGSLDHVLLNDGFLARATGADIWNINSGEALALEYSRYNSHGSLFYDTTPYRSSDHDPVVVGLAANATVPLNLLNINDFHGRIDANTVKFAGTVEQLRDAGGADNTLFLSAGDNIGATLYASASAKDQPTIDVLNALELKSSAVGNHEFDQGFADLTDRVINNAAPNAKWNYLGANVYLKGTTTPALDEYALHTVNGVRVGVIGVITQETPALVSPGGITTLDFGDPVDAVNRVAAQLSDGDAANGEADVLIAEYHEGAGAGTAENATLEQEIAAGGAFAKIVTQTDATVDAIFTGHTHKQYAWSAPVPGTTTGATRPVLQTGSYGEFIGQVVLTVDQGTGAVLAHTEANVKRTTVADATLVAAYPNVAAVKVITDAAIAAAAVTGNVEVGKVLADITTAYTPNLDPTKPPVRDDRASESTLGNLVANALRDSLADPVRGGAEIGVVNPGGLRADLLYSPDGVVTVAEANAVLPFLNNLNTTSLTGAQFKVLLEQQWQRDALGNVPSRPYLQLGLSDNVSYTYDAALPEGSRITSISVNGAPIDAAASYRIGTFSFLVTGGDNFRVFTQGTDTRDSGLVDRDAWISYLTTNSPVSPDFARHAVAVTGIPASVGTGEQVTLGVSKLDLTSLGSPANSALTATWEGSAAAPTNVAVAAGAATVVAVVPDDVVGNATLVLVASPSGTTVRVPITVTKTLTATQTTLSLSKTSVTYGSDVTAKVTVTGATTGQVTVSWGSGSKTVALVKGAATTKLPTDLVAGTYTVTATFGGTADAAPSTSAGVTLTVTGRASEVRASLVPSTVFQGLPAVVLASVRTGGRVATGQVTVTVDGVLVATKALVLGSAVVVLPSNLAVGKHEVAVSYLGNPTTAPSVDTETLTVKKWSHWGLWGNR